MSQVLVLKKWSPLKVVTVLITWRDQSGSFKMNISVLAVPSAIAVALIWEGGLSCSCNLRWLKMWDKKKCFVSSGLTGERNGLGVTAFRWHFLVLIMQRQKGVLSWVNGDRQNECTDSGGSSKCLVSTSGGGGQSLAKANLSACYNRTYIFNKLADLKLVIRGN